jgi:hypothetical protein
MSPLAERLFTTGITALRRQQQRDEMLAFAKLARTQRRLSWVARRRAIEAEERANLDDYRHFRAEARRLWRAAWWHLRRAQDRKEALYG